MKRLILFFTILLVSICCTWASNVITYTATRKLSETTDTYTSGLHTNAFNVSISSHTFSNGTGTITFSGEVTSIGDYAFRGCSSLTSITIPDGVTSIGSIAFDGCSGLTSVVWNAKNFSSPSSASLAPFYTIRSQIASFAFRDSVQAIPDYLCYGMSMTTVTIPNSVTSIGYRAFENCYSLTSITIPNSVTSIGNRAFYGCSGLTSAGPLGSGCAYEFGWIGSIPDNAFYKCSGLTSVTIPNSVTSIGERAFYGCSGLTSATIGNSVTSIRDYAFYECSGLTSVTIPNNVTSIGKLAFYGCSGLTSVVWNAKNCSSPAGLFRGLQITSFVFGDSVQNIPDYLCDGMNNLTSISISNSVTNIGSHAFYKCSGLTSVTIPNSVTSIGKMAFYGCSGLTSVTIGNSVTSIGDDAFYECSSLTSVTIPNNVTSIGQGAFCSCFGLTSLTIGKSVTSIGVSAFNGCSGLTTITCLATTPPRCFGGCFDNVEKNIPIFVPCYTALQYKQASQWKNFTNIQQIDGCADLEIIVMSSNDTLGSVIGSGEYAYMTNVVIEATPTAIAHFDHWSDGNTDNPRTLALTQDTTITAIFEYNWCGENCYWGFDNGTLTIYGSGTMNDFTAETIPWDSVRAEVTTLVINDGIASIGNIAFYNCSGLTSVIIPHSVTSIGYGAFAGCSGLTSVTIPNSVTSIGEYAFYECSGLTSVHVSDIASWCAMWFLTGSSNPLFYAKHLYLNGTEVTDLVIPNSVTSIGNYAFSGCSGLTSVTIPNSVTSIGYSAFEGCSGLTSVTIPNSVTSIEYHTFFGCSGLTSITIPNSVTSIGDNAFSHCSGLTSITCLATTPPICYYWGCFDNVEKNIPVFVPCYSAHLYKQAREWKDFTNIQQIDGCADLEIIVMSSNDTLGSVLGGGEYAYMTNVLIEATPTAIAHFDHWSDGNTDNPRTLSLMQDTTITAIFEYNRCGDNSYWGFDNGTLTIYGSGTMNDFTAEIIPWDSVRAEVTTLVINDGVTSIGDYAFYNCSNRAFNTLVLPHSIETIGDYAFANCSRLTSVTFGSELTEVGDYAFSGCSRISEMTCYAETTPDAYDNSFSGVKTAAYLYVPCDSKRAYTFDPYWGDFDIQCIGAETTTVTTSTVEVVPGDNEAVFTWPTDNNAASYSLVITKDGIVFCTLTFNANGQLTGLAFAPRRDGSAQAHTAVVSAAGMSFTVTGLNGATAYAFLFETKNAANQVIASYNGNFATTGYVEPTPTNVESVQKYANTPVKMVRDGQILIQRGSRLYDLRGQEVK